MGDRLEDEELRKRLQHSADGIGTHSAMLASLLRDMGQANGYAGSKGMEGLVEEAAKHVSDAHIDNTAHAAIAIARHQRLRHSGIAGFVTAKAFADAATTTSAK